MTDATRDWRLATPRPPSSRAIYERWLASGAFTPRRRAAGRGRAVRDHHAAAQRHRLAAHRPRPVRDAWRTSSSATTACAATTRCGCRASTTPASPPSSCSTRSSPRRGESRASLGRERYLERMWALHGRDARRHRPPDAPPGRLRRLDPQPVHDGPDAAPARCATAFKRLHDAGYVYRGEALVNWCPRCRTTISDLEKVPREEAGTLWTIRYHLAGPDGAPDPEQWIAIATTRPETLLGDVAVAVHPDDDRYRDAGRPRGDPAVPRPPPADHRRRGGGSRSSAPGRSRSPRPTTPTTTRPASGTASPPINVLDEEARINEAGGEFAGLDRFEARRADRRASCARWATSRREQPHQMVVGHCERCGTVVEPRLSDQWFVRTQPLAERALASVREGRTTDRAATHFEQGLRPLDGEHPRLGGRPPAVVGPPHPGLVLPRRPHHGQRRAETGPDACATCGRPAAELTQETDIFDTWFSSGLWPFSHPRLARRHARTCGASTRPR